MTSAKIAPKATGAKFADRAALAQVGTAVRQRLAADPAVHRIAVDKAELFAVGAFLSAAECEHIIAMIDAVAKPSTVFDPENTSKYRTSYSGDVDPTDSFVRMIERRICDLLGLDLTWGETMQGQRYLPGQEFREHFDWFDTSAHWWSGEVKRGGQRSWTAMAYLNAVDEGGATSFDRLGIAVEPQPGTLLVWNNALPDGRPNPDARHAALPVVSGVKYVVTKWFRTRRWS